MDPAWIGVNHTEVYQSCINAGMRIHPSTPKEVMVRYLTGEIDPPETPHKIDDWRDAIMRFVLDYWKKVHVQLKCPAGSGAPDACYGCVDTQVIACVTQSPNIIGLIEDRKVKR